MPAKVVLNRTCGSDIFVYADPDMVKEWRHNHSAPLEFILTGNGTLERRASPIDLAAVGWFCISDYDTIIREILEEDEIKEINTE
ncbi:hypothetical protein CU097_008544 [Rhizopus azygosporus]|uniref:Ribosome maturation protein SDO1/SBDS N-terminal domain-containing protein n=1 Tax=Rhizopus azygosporus TaxID=86630 RepID=A0A367JFJ6_RHIAZ|nr:hypothetical protein CU097_008544 [Rhizopus azygosporus]